MDMTGIRPYKRHPRDRVIVLLHSKRRQKSGKDVRPEVALEVDDLESIPDKDDGEDIQLKGEGKSVQLHTWV